MNFGGLKIFAAEVMSAGTHCDVIIFQNNRCNVGDLGIRVRSIQSIAIRPKNGK